MQYPSVIGNYAFNGTTIYVSSKKHRYQVMYATPKPQIYRIATFVASVMVAVMPLCAISQPIPLRLGEDPSVTESAARIARGVQLWGTPQAQPELDIRFMDLDITVLPSTKSISATAIKRFTISAT